MALTLIGVPFFPEGSNIKEEIIAAGNAGDSSHQHHFKEVNWPQNLGPKTKDFSESFGSEYGTEQNLLVCSCGATKVVSRHGPLYL